MDFLFSAWPAFFSLLVQRFLAIVLYDRKSWENLESAVALDLVFPFVVDLFVPDFPWDHFDYCLFVLALSYPWKDLSMGLVFGLGCCFGNFDFYSGILFDN